VYFTRGDSKFNFFIRSNNKERHHHAERKVSHVSHYAGVPGGFFHCERVHRQSERQKDVLELQAFPQTLRLARNPGRFLFSQGRMPLPCPTVKGFPQLHGGKHCGEFAPHED